MVPRRLHQRHGEGDKVYQEVFLQRMHGQKSESQDCLQVKVYG